MPGEGSLCWTNLEYFYPPTFYEKIQMAYEKSQKEASFFCFSPSYSYSIFKYLGVVLCVSSMNFVI